MGIIHWLISFSFFKSTITLDGGDEITSILMLLLIPFCLSDQRQWHWQAASNRNNEQGPYANISLWVLSFLIRIQVCVIYFHAGISKLATSEWVDGTAIYYWFNNNEFGASNWLKPIISYIFSFPITVFLVTWGTMAFEILLGMSIMMKRGKYNWRILLLLGVTFHFFIIIIHGLISFYFAMVGALILYLIPLEKNLSLSLKSTASTEHL